MPSWTTQRWWWNWTHTWTACEYLARYTAVSRSTGSTGLSNFAWKDYTHMCIDLGELGDEANTGVLIIIICVEIWLGVWLSREICTLIPRSLGTSARRACSTIQTMTLKDSAVILLLLWRTSGRPLILSKYKAILNTVLCDMVISEWWAFSSRWLVCWVLDRILWLSLLAREAYCNRQSVFNGDI